MPTDRSTGSKADSMRTSFNTYLSDFGTTIVRNRIAETKDSMNRVTATTSTSVTYMADVQWLNKQDLLHLNVGDVKIGDGMLFVKYNVDIELDDEIVINSTTWRVTSQIEGELVGGKVTYKAYIIQKDAQS